MAALFIALGAIVLTYAAAGTAVFFIALFRRDTRDLNYDGVSDEASFLPSGKSPFRRLSHESNIWWNKQALERRQIESEGLKLTGHLLRAPQPTVNLAVVVHGHLNVSGEMGFIARMYRSRGFDVFMPDQRAHGKSEGRLIGMGERESRDLLLWLKMLLEERPERKIVLHGISMGAATVMLASAKEGLPEGVRCAVEDCGYTNAFDAILVTAKDDMKWLPFSRAALGIASGINLLLTGRSLKRVSPLEAVKRAQIPTLFIHGTADAVVPLEMCERLYESCCAPKARYIVEGAAHGVAYFSDTAAYEKAVFDFIVKYMD
ncbi:MAG: alpha/beta hydrolase [Oscillospiraceae bacterium]|nr:alpha/beta hydrolase [Oscillospiraceae bacterium]